MSSHGTSQIHEDKALVMPACSMCDDVFGVFGHQEGSIKDSGSERWFSTGPLPALAALVFHRSTASFGSAALDSRGHHSTPRLKQADARHEPKQVSPLAL